MGVWWSVEALWCVLVLWGLLEWWCCCGLGCSGFWGWEPVRPGEQLGGQLWQGVAVVVVCCWGGCGGQEETPLSKHCNNRSIGV